VKIVRNVARSFQEIHKRIRDIACIIPPSTMQFG